MNSTTWLLPGLAVGLALLALRLAYLLVAHLLARLGRPSPVRARQPRRTVPGGRFD